MIEESLKEQQSDPLIVVAGIINENTGKRDLLSEMVEILLIENLTQKEKYPLVEYSQIQSLRKEWIEAFPDSTPEQVSQDLADLLGADWSVTGSYWIQEGRFELQLQLYESEIDRVIWKGQTESFAEYKGLELKIAEERESEQDDEPVSEKTPIETAVSETEQDVDLIPEDAPVVVVDSESEQDADFIPEETAIETVVSETEQDPDVPREAELVESEETSELISEDIPIETSVSETEQDVDLIPEDALVVVVDSESEQDADFIPEETAIETVVSETEQDTDVPREAELVESEETSELISEDIPAELSVSETRQEDDLIPEDGSVETVVTRSTRASELPPQVALLKTIVTQTQQGPDLIPEVKPTEATVVESEIPYGFILLSVIPSSSQLEEVKSSEQTKEYSNELTSVATDELRVSQEEERIVDEMVSSSQREIVKISQMEGMVFVAGGSFSMGSNMGEEDEQPVHSVYLHSYFIDTHEVTNEEYARCDRCEKGSGGFDTTEPDQPVVYVDWKNADTYCRFVGKRLPTEAEWENSARAGSKTEYSFGDVQQLTSYAWYDENTEQQGERYTHKVGTKEPNAWNIYDMHGNVMEWTSDRYVMNYYQKIESNKPWYIFNFYYNAKSDHPFKLNISATQETHLRVVRGGAWGGLFGTGDALQLRSAKRFAVAPWVRSFLIGFRCAADGNPSLQE